jgi:hypothetical protein
MKAAQPSTSVPFEGSGGGYGSAVPIYSDEASWDRVIDRLFSGGTKIDYAAELGFGLTRMVAAATRWVGKNLNDARFQVVTLDSDNKESEIVDHPLAGLFKRPNKYYGSAALLRGIALSWILKAEAYVLVLKSYAGRPVQLWYEPHWSIRPVWPTDGSEFISYYEIKRNGRWVPFDLNDEYRSVFVLRDGIDMATRGGIQTLESVIKDIYTDEQFSRFTAQLGKHGLVPPTIFSVGDKERPFTGNIKDVENKIQRKMGGDNAGKPLVTTDNVTPHKLTVDYSSMGIKEVRELAEAAFCSVVGISAESLRFSVAGNHSTYNNVREHRLADYQDYIKPLHSLIAEESDVQLLPSFSDKGRVRCQWNYDKVEILQPNKKDEWHLMFEGFKARAFNLAQTLEGIGYKPQPGDEKIYYPVPQNTITLSPIGESPIDDGIPEDVKPNGSTKPN